MPNPKGGKTAGSGRPPRALTSPLAILKKATAKNEKEKKAELIAARTQKVQDTAQTHLMH